MIDEEELTRVINDQKAQLTAIKCMLDAFADALPPEAHERVMARWDIRIDVARTAMLNSTYPDNFTLAFERHVADFEELRRLRHPK